MQSNVTNRIILGQEPELQIGRAERWAQSGSHAEEFLGSPTPDLVPPAPRPPLDQRSGERCTNEGRSLALVLHYDTFTLTCPLSVTSL
ncbi:hypothetical protein UPYG_G00202990 [Umbra pygmaea]|uniref:Uncharacterized protein n=1 Tax=Umbra pygmaea TaxID=75934 RepID=A0ABD0WJJ9_UMBPY